jgi:hypothetical protein
MLQVNSVLIKNSRQSVGSCLTSLTTD